MSLLWFCSKKPLYGGKLVRQEKLKISISISCISPFVILVKMSLPFYSTLTSLCDLIPISLVSWPGARRAHSMNPPRHGIRTTLQSPLVNFRIQYIFCAQKLLEVRRAGGFRRQNKRRLYQKPKFSPNVKCAGFARFLPVPCTRWQQRKRGSQPGERGGHCARFAKCKYWHVSRSGRALSIGRAACMTHPPRFPCYQICTLHSAKSV